MSKCKLCDRGHEPKINGTSVEHWIVKSIFPARITIKECKEPEAARTRQLLDITLPTRQP